MYRLEPFCPALAAVAFALAIACGAAPNVVSAGPTLSHELAKADHGFRYYNDVLQDVPLSVHIVKVERGHSEFEFLTTLGQGPVLGMGTVSEQVKFLSAHGSQPLAAINGDFYQRDEAYYGRPRDLQLIDGELISAPAGHACFWVDPAGAPHLTNVFSDFRVVWPDGKASTFGLNEARRGGGAVLYTPRVGSATRTSGGEDLVLEIATNSALPLKPCESYEARVAAVRPGGNAPLKRGVVVLSVGPNLKDRLPPISPGARLRLSTRTVPDLTGVQVAIGGGPMLVRGGKPLEWTGFLKMRHPRSAIGWNKEHVFLVQVDGRQSDYSIGMTFPELAQYLARLGCEEAMNLDGGGSATLWVLGSVRNRPSEGQERPSPNVLVLMSKRPSVTVSR